MPHLELRRPRPGTGVTTLDHGLGADPHRPRGRRSALRLRQFGLGSTKQIQASEITAASFVACKDR
jgi:hypothetical protein